MSIFEELFLNEEISATEAIGNVGELQQAIPMEAGKAGVEDSTEGAVLGPYYRRGAPYRAKITVPYEPGTPLVITGRVWGFDTKQPLPGALIDIWQADQAGRYDNQDPTDPPVVVYRNRARVVADERGRYEFETIHPGPYKIDEKIWRSPHIHYLVQYQGYESLVTQLFFSGDPYQDIDPFIKRSLIIQLQRIGSELPSVFRLPSGGFQATRFSSC